MIWDLLGLAACFVAAIGYGREHGMRIMHERWLRALHCLSLDDKIKLLREMDRSVHGGKVK